MAKDHLPTAPSISKLPTVSGSGVGVVYYTHTHFPEKYQEFIHNRRLDQQVHLSLPHHMGRCTDEE